MRKLYNVLWSALVVVILFPALGNAQAKIVISQVYGGGGNTGATLTHDFIELFNAGNQAQSLTDWSVQYSGATATTWQVTNLSGTIQPGQYFLIQQAQGAGGTEALPTPNVTGSIAMAANNGKVALVNSTTALTGACPTESIIDFVGYGTANCSETAPTAALSNTTAAKRNNNGCTDTDNNSLDFTVGTPTPRNTSSTTFSCSTPNPLNATGTSNPAEVAPGGTTLLTVTVTPATEPNSTGINVQADLSTIGGAATQTFYDDGTNGDGVANDNIFSFSATVSAGTLEGNKQLTATITDAQSRSANTSIALTVKSPTPTPVGASVVISQVYGGGGNAGATLKNDFIELFNRSSQDVDLTGWSVQYATATGTLWQVTPISGVLKPGQYLLIQQAAGAGGTRDLPTPDIIGTIAMAAGSGKVALVNSTTAITGTGCPNFPSSVVDYVGYGSSNCAEGGSSNTTPVLSNTTAAIRLNNGCTDTDNNRSDFEIGAPTPRNNANPLNECSDVFRIVTTELPEATTLQTYQSSIVAAGGDQPYKFSLMTGALPNGIVLGEDGSLSGTPLTPGTASFTIKATDAKDIERTREFSINVLPAPECNPTVTIAEVQGEGLTSPLLGSNVTISGIVTGRKGNGYFIQMGEGDGNPNTSDALFIFTSTAPPAFVQPGNELCVTGTVFEFVSSLDPGGRTITQLTTTTAFVTNINKILPNAIVLTVADLTPGGGLDQLEKYENMRVTVPSLTVVAPTQGSTNEVQATGSSNGFFYGVITGTPRPFREPGIQEPLTVPVGAPATVQRWDGNPELIGVASSAQPGNAPMDVAAGDVVLNMTGPLDFLRKYFVINADGAGNPEVVVNNTGATPVPVADNDELTVASYNLERFFDTVDDPSISDPVVNPIAFDNRLNKAALGIINLMRMPDVIGFQEIETISALQALANRVNQRAVEAGFDNPAYVAFLEEGNDAGGIDVGFLVKTTRIRVESVTQFGKNTTFTNPTTGNQDILNDRPPLVLKASFLNPTGCRPPVPFIVISNHLRSLNGNDNLTDGRVRTKRLEQAKFLASLINSFTSEDPNIKLISLGDYNAFEFNDGYVDIVGTVKGTPVDASLVTLPSPVVTNPALINLVDGLSPEIRYSYVFFGSAQHLDHIMVNPNMNQHVTKMVPVHFNADYPEAIRGDFARPERISDHDPLVAYFKFPADENSFSCSITPILGPGPNTNAGPNQLYIGYGPKSVTLQTQVLNGSPVSYQWSSAVGLSCTDCAAPEFTPTMPGLYTISVNITNEDGCSTTCEVSICVLDIRVPGRNSTKVFLCHRPRRNPTGKTIRERIEKLEMRLRNKDSRLGDCNNGNCETTLRSEIITYQTIEPKATIETVKTRSNDGESLRVKALPNPTSSTFNFEINSSINSPVNVRILDASGKTLESKSNIHPNSTIRMGSNLKDGMYFAEFIQKGNRVILKIVKTK